ncbi:uncharacterized protein LOC116774134 isoform X1 [Danaus plexippus]|uniref:uncharacterized protein LOC116774134 isoform X1 n=1 Tax=Danaus plexippus TaxID=13037 RepID=UPI002AB2C7A1|nr:uncharacterized protein LOC116774134 isoform X1 [Danaus plexippus]
MRVIFLLFGAICILCLDFSGTFADQKCYEAKICIHDGKEKCGQDEKGNVRRFLDSCDIKEYNCLQKADYVKVDKSECKDLPRIPDSDTKGNTKETKQKHSDVKKDEDDEEEGDSEVQNVTNEKVKRSKDDKKSSKNKSKSKKTNKKSRN